MTDLILWQEHLWHTITLPIAAVLDPSRRVFWPFLVFAIALSLIVLSVQQKKISVGPWLTACFSNRYLFSRSSAQDISLWLINGAIRIFALVPLLGGHLLFTLIVVRFLHSTFGTPTLSPPPVLVIMSLYTLVFLLVEDASRYGLHRLMHHIPWLWHFHKVHHSATVLTPFTLFRVHPIEMLFYYLRGTLVFGCVSGVFIFLWGRHVSGWQILGVDAIGFLFNLAAANLRHSHIWLSFGIFEKWFISPAQHQLHHSNNPKHFNLNYGASLAIWDRAFKSWLPAKTKPSGLSFGLLSK